MSNINIGDDVEYLKDKSGVYHGVCDKWAREEISKLSEGALSVDEALNSSSRNPVENRAVKVAIDGKADKSHRHDASEIDGLPSEGSDVTVDAELNGASANPVQNKAIYSALAGKADKSALENKADKTALGTAAGKNFTETVAEENSDLITSAAVYAALSQLGGGIKSVQRGVFRGEQDSLKYNVPVTINITAVNPEKSAVILNDSMYSYGGGVTSGSYVTTFTSTALTIMPNGNSSHGTFDVGWQVIEFN